MNNSELVARMAVVTKMMLCFGVTDQARIEAIVEATAGIPWFVPEFRGNEDAGDLLFPIAVQMAGQKTTYGAPSQGHITEAAILIAGSSKASQGNKSPRRWVTEMQRRPSPLGMTTEAMMSIDAPRTLEIEAGSYDAR